jgi:hypothetical protein
MSRGSGIFKVVVVMDGSLEVELATRLVFETIPNTRNTPAFASVCGRAFIGLVDTHVLEYLDLVQGAKHRYLIFEHFEPFLLVSNECKQCGVRGATLRCGGCRSIYYCGQHCQRLDWTGPYGHKYDCSTKFLACYEEHRALQADARIAGFPKLHNAKFQVLEDPGLQATLESYRPGTCSEYGAPSPHFFFLPRNCSISANFVFVDWRDFRAHFFSKPDTEKFPRSNHGSRSRRSSSHFSSCGLQHGLDDPALVAQEVHRIIQRQAPPTYRA